MYCGLCNQCGQQRAGCLQGCGLGCPLCAESTSRQGAVDLGAANRSQVYEASNGSAVLVACQQAGLAACCTLRRHTGRALPPGVSLSGLCSQWQALHERPLTGREIGLYNAIWQCPARSCMVRLNPQACSAALQAATSDDMQLQQDHAHALVHVYEVSG